MNGFDFGQIGSIISQYMDSDYVDIKRDIAGQLKEVYSNVKCNLSIVSTDNPDPLSVDIKPIIQSIDVHLDNFIDVRNNDYLIAKKMDNMGNILITYSGRCGYPNVTQGRKKVNMQMSSTGQETPTPPPPKDPAKIIIEYRDNDTTLQPANIEYAEVGSQYTVYPANIEGYTPFNVLIDDIPQDKTTAEIQAVKAAGHTIVFLYNVQAMPEYLRLLVNGTYTRDDGILSNGYHLYKKIGITVLSNNGSMYKIRTNVSRVIHDDMGKTLNFTLGTKMVLFPDKLFVSIVTEPLKDEGGLIFDVAPFSPTEPELNAYLTSWYDV